MFLIYTCFFGHIEFVVCDLEAKKVAFSPLIPFHARLTARTWRRAINVHIFLYKMSHPPWNLINKSPLNCRMDQICAHRRVLRWPVVRTSIKTLIKKPPASDDIHQFLQWSAFLFCYVRKLSGKERKKKKISRHERVENMRKI